MSIRPCEQAWDKMPHATHVYKAHATDEREAYTCPGYEKQPPGPYDHAPESTLTGVVQPPPEVRISSGEDCTAEGHDFEFVVNGAGELLRVLCERCSSAWRVDPL